MKVKISYDLTMKLISLDEPDLFEVCAADDCSEITFDVDLEDEKLSKECLIWIHHIETYFKTSYNSLKLDIGPFEGLWPIKGHYNSTMVTFRADWFDPDRKNWRDWFIEYTENAPQFIQEEI